MQKMWLTPFNFFEIAVTVCKKQWIWQLLQNIEGKFYTKFEFSDQNVHNTGLYTGLKFAFKITNTKPDFLWNVNVQIATVCIGSFFLFTGAHHEHSIVWFQSCEFGIFAFFQDSKNRTSRGPAVCLKVSCYLICKDVRWLKEQDTALRMSWRGA